jgi:ATP-dependent DNA ligase
MSRGGKEYKVPHIQNGLAATLPVGYILDGEIWREGLSCQTVTSYVKKTKPGTETLVYNVFDLPSHGGTWESRREALNAYFDGEDYEAVACINKVETISPAAIHLIDSMHDVWVTKGYEGAIIRLHTGLYEWGERSRSLMKYKKFQDAEFRVVSVRAGEGKLSKAAVFTCENDLTRATFDVIFAGTIDQREEQLTNAKNYVNKKLTVRFFDRTDDKLPRFPVGKVFREEKDL